jgi:hypothetical protein
LTAGTKKDGASSLGGGGTGYYYEIAIPRPSILTHLTVDVGRMNSQLTSMPPPKQGMPPN